MKLRSTLFFAAASLSASALLPVAATTSAFFAASAVPAQAWEIDETTGLPDATLPGTATTVSEEHLVSEDTAYSFTDAGQDSSVNIALSNGAGALLLPSGQNSQYALGTVSGDGDVWFGGGRWRVQTTGTTNITSTGTLYLSGAQFWVTDGQGAGGAFSPNNDVVLGLSNFSGDGIPALDNTALRVDAAVTLNGTTTIIPAGTRIGFQNGKDLTIANLAGSGDIETSAYNDSASTLTISDSSNYTGTITVASSMELVWNDADAETVRVANATSSHNSQFTFAENFDGKVIYSGNLDPTRLTLGENAQLELSGSGTNNSTWNGSAGTLSADVLFRTDYTLGHAESAALTLSGNVSADEGTTLTVNRAATFSGETTSLQSFVVNSSGSATFSTGAATIAGSLTSAGTISVSGGSLTIGGNGVTVSLANGIAVSAGATVTVNAGTTFLLDAMTRGEGGVYTLFSGEGTVAAPQSGWTFLLDDVDVATRGTLSADGKTLTVENYSLTWDGGQSGTWDTTSENWTGESTTFFPGDSVTFNTANAVITVRDEVVPAGVTISQATTFTGAGTVSVAPESLTIGEGASLTLAGGVTLDFGTIDGGTIEKTILSSAEDRGRVKIVSTLGGHDTQIRLGEGFNGTLVYSGKLNTNNFTVGADARLELSTSSAGGSIWGTGTIANDILFTSNYRVGDSSNATITLSGALTAAEGTTLTLGGTRVEASGTQVNLSGNVAADIVMQEWGTTTFTGAANISALNVSGGTLNFSGNADIGTVNVKGGTVNFAGTATADRITLDNANSSVTVSDNVSTTQYYGTATSARGANTSTISDTGVLNITGTVSSSAGDPASSNAAFALTHWGSTHTFNVAGVLNVANAGISNVDGAGVLNINNGGEANFGAGLWVVNRYGSVTVNLNEGGTLNLGANADGVGINNSNFTLNLNGGTIGSLAESWSSSRAMTLGGNVTFDTTQKEINAASAATIVTAAEGGNAGAAITLSGVLSGEGSLTKTGAGTLELNNNNTYSGGTTVEEGTLVARRDGALGSGKVSVTGGDLRIHLNGDGNIVIGSSGKPPSIDVGENGSLTISRGQITVQEGGSVTVDGTFTVSDTLDLGGNAATGRVAVTGGALDLSGANVVIDADADHVTLSGGTLNLSGATVTARAGFAVAGTAVTVSADTTFVLDNMTRGEGGVYTFFTVNSGAVTGFDALDGGNFTLGGVEVGSRGAVDATNYTLTLTTYDNLVWAGGTEGTWNSSDQSWTVGEGGAQTTFFSGDSVTFNTENALVTVEGTLAPDGVTISAATTFTGTGTVSPDSLTIGEGASLTLAEGVTWALAGQQATGENSLLSKFSGAGTVSFATSTNYGNVLKFADGFTGTAHMTAGNFTINGSKFGSTLVLGDGVNFQLTGGSLVQIGGTEPTESDWTYVAGSEIVLEGTSQIHQNSGANLTINADVSGSGTYDRRGGGALIFNGNVELGGFIATSSGNCTTTFTGTTTIDTVTVKGGTVNFASSDAEIGALNFTANDGNVVFSLAEGAAGTTYTLGAVALDATTSYTRNFSVGEGVTVNATSLANRWGMGALTVDGELNFSGDLKFATGSNNSTENNVITGTGTLRVNSLTFGNVGVYNISVDRIEVGSGGIIYDDNGGNNGVPTVNLGATTIAATESWSNGYGDDAVTPRLTLVSARAADEDGVLSGGTFFEVVGADTVAEIEAEIRGEGALVKTGEGTLTLSGANTLTGTLEVREGTLAAVSAGALGAGDVVVAGGTLEIDGTLVELASGATLTLEEAGAVSVANGALFEILGTLDLDHAIDVAGTVSVESSAVFVLEWDSEGGNSQTFTLFDLTNGGTLDWTGLTTDNISVDVSLRGGSAVFNDNGTVTVTTGGSGESITLVWNGGAAGDWNTTETNWSHEGKEERFCAGDNVVFDTNGDVSVSVAPAGVRPGAVTISAGTVSFTGGQVTARDGFFIGGGESSATLKLTANDNIAGDVTVNAGGALDLNGQSEDISEEGLGRLTLNGGSLVNNGGNVGVGSAQITSVALTADSTFGGTRDFGIIARGYAATSLDLGGHTLTKQGANTLHLVNTSVTAGTLAVTAGTVSMTVNAGEVDFAADVEVADDASFTFNMTGGSAMFSGSVDITGTANVSGGGATTFTGAQNTIGDLRFGNGIVNFGSAENASAGTGISSVTTVGSIVMGHTNNAGTLNVRADAALTVTGSSMSTGGSAGSFMIGNYPQAQTVNVSGALNLQNAGITTRDGRGTVNVNSGGEVNFNAGLTFADNGSNAGAITVVLNDGGRMNIGAGGIQAGNVLTLTLNGGATIGSLADSWSSSRALTLGGSVTFDTTLMEFNASGKATETEDGSDVTLSGALSGSGSLVKTGEGTLTLSGALSYTGGTTVEAGTLQLMLGGDYMTGDVSVASGATLQLSSAGDAVNFGGTADAPVTLTLGEGSVLSGGEGTVNLTAGTTLAFTGADGSSVDASEATLTYRSGEGGGTLIFADDREFGAFVFDSQGAVSSAGVGRNATLSAGELSFADSANRGAEMSGAGTLAVGKISVNNTRSGNEISVGTLELTQAETEISVARNGSLEISSDKIVFSEGVEDGTLVKTGAGTLTVGDAFQDDFAGSLRVDAGTVSTNLLNLSGALTLAAGTTFDGSVDASAGSRVGLGAGARIDGDLTLTGATATLGEATVTGDLTVSGTKMTFNGTVSGIGTLTWGDGNGINLGEAFRAEISSAGNGVLLDFNVGLDGDGNPLTEDFDFDFDASALADSFLGRDVDLVYNEKDTSIEIVVTGALVWNETVTHWTVSGAGSSGHEHDQWDVVTRDGVSEESAFFENGDFVQFTTAGSTRLVGTVNGGSSFAGKGTEPLGDGIVRTAGIVFDIEGGGAFTLESKKRYNNDGELVDDGQSVLNSTAQGKDEGITVLSGDVTIGENVVNNLVGGTKVYGGSLTVYAADALGNGAIEVGNTASATRATLTFAQEGALAVDRTISVGNANAQIGVTNAAAVVSLDRVVKNAAAEEGAALTKLGAGTLNIGRGDYADAELLDRVAVNAGTLTFTGDDGGLPTRNVSVASGATLNVEHGGDAVAFDAMDVAGTVIVGSAQDAAHGFSAGTISATGAGGEISGALQLDGASFEVENAGVATTYEGTLFYAEDADQSLAFTGTVSAAADSEAALYKAGAGTVSFASGTTEKFRLDADLVLDGGTVSFGEGVAASGELRVTSSNTRIEVSRTSGTPTDGRSSFSDLNVAAGASVTFALGNGMWTTDSVSGANIGLTLSGEIAAENGSVAFASTGGSSTLRGTVGIENAESATFRQLTVGGTGTNIVDLSVGNGVKEFSAYAVALYGASSLNFANLQEGKATIGALQVIDNAGNAAKLDLGGGTLSLENDENVAVLYGDGTLRISNGTLNVSGQNYSAEHTPGIVLVDGATFNFDVAENDGAAYSSLREITTEGSGGTVSKSGAGTLVLYLDDETGQPVAGDITFDGAVSLDEGETHLYATLADANLSVADAATLRLFTTAKTAEGGNAPEGVSLLAKTISGAGTIAVSGVLHANGGLENFTGALHANGGKVVAYEALSGAATAGGNAAFAGSISLSDEGILAAAENVTIANVDVDGQNAFESFEGAALTVKEVAATAGTSLTLAGAGTLENAAFAAPAEGETATNSISVSGDWTLAGAATGVDSVSVTGALTLGAGSAIDADAALSVNAGGTLTLEKAEAYANKISLDGGTVAADAGAGQTVSLTNVSAGAGSVFSAESGTLSVSAANLVDGASALRFDAAAEAVVQLDVDGTRTLDGALSGEGTFEKAGAGTLTLDSGSHDVANIAVSAGTLSVTDGAAFSGKGTLSVADGAKLESDGGQLNGFTLTGAGTATVSGKLGGIENAADVALDGALSVSGNVSGSALAFEGGASLKGAGTTVSGTTLSGGTVTLETLTVAEDSTFADDVSTLKLQGQAGTSGAVAAAFAGSLEKSGDGTWTVSNYSVENGDSLKVSAGTLVWQNADFADGSTITADGTLRIEGAATETLAGTIGGRGTLELRNTDATLDIEAASGASWTLNVAGTSAVTVNAALPGALRVGDTATATLNLEEDATLKRQLNIASSGATLVKTGAGMLTVGTSSATTPHNIFGTLRVEEGAVSQKTAMSWMNNSVLYIGENGTFIVDLGSDAAKSSAKLTGTGTLEIASTGADGYTLEGSVKAFAGTLTVAAGATLNLRNGVFADGAKVTVEEGGVLAFMGREGGEISGVSGKGTLRVDMTVTPGADSSYLTGAYVYGDNAGFEGSVEVKSGILSVSAEDFATLAGRISVGGGGSAEARYVDDGLSAGGVEQGAFLRLSGGGDLNGAFDGFESSVKEKGGVLLSAGSFSASSDFGSATAEGQLYVAEKDAQLTLSDGASVGGSLFVASGAELVLGTAAASSASAAGTQTFAAEDAGTVPPDGVSGVSGAFTLNGKLTCLVSDATNLSAPLLAVAGTTTVNTAANKNAFKPEIVLDIGGFSGSLEGLTIVDSGGGIVSGAGSINQYVSVTDSAGGKWVVVKNSDGSLVLSSGTQDGYGVSGNMSGVFDALYSEEEGSFFQRELSDKQGGELTSALVSLSPVSFGSLIEMQSGFASLENDLLRERLEQRRYERTFASDRSTKFKPFVNILGADREGDGDGTDAANYDITHAGAIGGFDFAVSDNTIVGVSIGVDWAKADLKDGAGKHEGEGSRIGVYGMTVFENAYVGYGLSAGGMSFDTKRHFGDRTMTGDTDGNDVNATLLFGAGWTLSDAYGIDLAPYVGLDIGYVTADSFTESGSADTALDTDSIDRWSLRGKIGATLSWRATERLRIGLDAMFAHEFGDSDIDIDAKIGGNAFSSKAYLMDENTIQIGPRIDFRIDDTWSVSAAYAFETDLDETTTHSANLGVRARF